MGAGREPGWATVPQVPGSGQVMCLRPGGGGGGTWPGGTRGARGRAVCGLCRGAELGRRAQARSALGDRGTPLVHRRRAILVLPGDDDGVLGALADGEDDATAVHALADGVAVAVPHDPGAVARALAGHAESLVDPF